MANYIYIAGSFETVNKSKCGRGKGWIDNDPHFWCDPPTWGICRNDLRKKTDVGDYIFFVLPKHAKLPQMIFGYMKVEKKISHLSAYHLKSLTVKRMGSINPNGNIIVDSKGGYSRFDAGVHKDKFEKIKKEYVVGDINASIFLNEQKIKNFAPFFMDKLSKVTGKQGRRPIDIITRYGRELSNNEVKQLIYWLS